MTTGSKTFTIPDGITASIYNPSDLTTPIATSNINPSIPVRPSGDSVNCGGTDPNGYADNSRWFDPVSGECKYSLSVPLTFTFGGQTLPNTVVWTVQFNTTHGGYSPIGEATTCFDSGAARGCGYDSLNVGTKTYDGSPYVGTDVAEDTVYISNGNTAYSPPLVALHAVTDAGWVGYRPLGEIFLGP